MARGFVDLACVVDWFTRRVPAWRLSITMEVDFRLAAVEEAIAEHGPPTFVNTDQGSQFTSARFKGLLREPGQLPLFKKRMRFLLLPSCMDSPKPRA